MLINEVIAVQEKDQDFAAGLLAKIQAILTVAMSRDIKKISTKKFSTVSQYTDMAHMFRDISRKRLLWVHNIASKND